MSEYKETVVAVGDEVCSFEVNTSDAACQQFGFKSGDRIRARLFNTEGVVAGVAPLPNGATAHCIPDGSPVLWVKMDGDEGKVCFFPHPETGLEKI